MRCEMPKVLKSFRVASSLSNRMQQHKHVNWSDVVSRAIEQRLDEEDGGINRQLFGIAKAKGLSTNGLAKASGITQPSLHRFFHGEQGLEFAALVRLMKTLNVRLTQ